MTIGRFGGQLCVHQKALNWSSPTSPTTPFLCILYPVTALYRNFCRFFDILAAQSKFSFRGFLITRLGWEESSPDTMPAFAFQLPRDLLAIPFMSTTSQMEVSHEIWGCPLNFHLDKVYSIEVEENARDLSMLTIKVILSKKLQESELRAISFHFYNMLSCENYKVALQRFQLSMRNSPYFIHIGNLKSEGISLMGGGLFELMELRKEQWQTISNWDIDRNNVYLDIPANHPSGKNPSYAHSATIAADPLLRRTMLIYLLDEFLKTPLELLATHLARVILRNTQEGMQVIWIINTDEITAMQYLFFETELPLYLFKFVSMAGWHNVTIKSHLVDFSVIKVKGGNASVDSSKLRPELLFPDLIYSNISFRWVPIYAKALTSIKSTKAPNSSSRGRLVRQKRLKQNRRPEANSNGVTGSETPTKPSKNKSTNAPWFESGQMDYLPLVAAFPWPCLEEESMKPEKRSRVSETEDSATVEADLGKLNDHLELAKSIGMDQSYDFLPIPDSKPAEMFSCLPVHNEVCFRRPLFIDDTELRDLMQMESPGQLNVSSEPMPCSASSQSIMIYLDLLNSAVGPISVLEYMSSSSGNKFSCCFDSMRSMCVLSIDAVGLSISRIRLLTQDLSIHGLVKKVVLVSKA